MAGVGTAASVPCELAWGPACSQQRASGRGGHSEGRGRRAAADGEVDEAAYSAHRYQISFVPERSSRAISSINDDRSGDVDGQRRRRSGVSGRRALRSSGTGRWVKFWDAPVQRRRRAAAVFDAGEVSGGEIFGCDWRGRRIFVGGGLQRRWTSELRRKRSAPQTKTAPQPRAEARTSNIGVLLRPDLNQCTKKESRVLLYEESRAKGQEARSRCRKGRLIQAGNDGVLFPLRKKRTRTLKLLYHDALRADTHHLPG